MTRFENVGVFIQEKVWLENRLSLFSQAIFEPNSGYANAPLFYVTRTCPQLLIFTLIIYL